MVTDHEMRMKALSLYEENILLRKALTEIAEAIRPEWADDPGFLVDIAKEAIRRTSPLAANDGRVRLVDQNGAEVVGAGPACACCKKIPTPDCDNPACAFRDALGGPRCNHWPGQKRCEVCGMGTKTP